MRRRHLGCKPKLLEVQQYRGECIFSKVGFSETVRISNVKRCSRQSKAVATCCPVIFLLKSDHRFDDPERQRFGHERLSASNRYLYMPGFPV